MENQPRIAIVGAGPGGLTLARILHLHGLRASVFEREECSSVRPQGWSLDMHRESGQFALECAGLTAEFQRIARYGDQEARVYDKHGNLRFADTDVSGKDRPEVDRGHLRQILLDSLPDEVVRWNHPLTGIERQDDGWLLQFPHGQSEPFDLIVGADGAWSRVRPLVSPARPLYSGVLFVEIGIADVDARHPDIARLVGHGMMFALGDSKALIAHRNANQHIGAYAALHAPESGIDDLDPSSTDTLKASLAAHFGDWSDDLQQLIYCCDGEMTPRPIHALPVGHRWEHRTGVTLLGDAAHLMSPFGGDGANLAMWDAADLALALAAEDDWDAAVAGFETTMFARAEEAAAGARDRVDEVFSDKGLSQVVGFMEWQQSGGHHDSEEPRG